MLASELHDTISKDYIKSVDIETQLYGENAEMYASPADLNDGDIINLTIHFADAQMTIREFAKDCKDILEDMHELSYNFGKIDFVADDRINHYVLNVDWHYQSDFSADKLAGFVNYFGDDISDTDNFILTPPQDTVYNGSEQKMPVRMPPTMPPTPCKPNASRASS